MTWNVVAKFAKKVEASRLHIAMGLGFRCPFGELTILKKTWVHQ